jgi:hypothetical protein
MLEFLKFLKSKLLKKDRETKDEKENKLYKYSSTTEPATTGVDIKRLLDPKVNDILTRFLNNNQITREEANTLIKFYFNYEIEPCLYKFNAFFKEYSIFNITGLTFIIDPDTKDVRDCVLVLNESINNIEMQITMPLATFRENFIKYIPELVNSQLP